MENEYKLNLANDLGYGAVKATLNGNRFMMPSVIAQEHPEDITSPIEFNNEEAKQVYMDNFLNNMDVTVSSSSVTRQGRFLVGRAAVNSQLPLNYFDVNDYAGKSDDDLAVILTLSLIAGNTVKEAFKAGDSLTNTLKVNVTMATALPISEGKRDKVRNNYSQKYTGSTHTVTFHNFNDPITVSIKFDKTYVALEGETAQLMIKNATSALSSALLNDFKKNYPDFSDIKADDITNSNNVLGIDIGEGTTDLVSVINGKVNANASSSLPQGYGNLLQSAIDVLQEKQMNFENRAQLQEYLSSTVSPFAKQHQKRVQDIVNSQLDGFAEQIIQAVSKAMRLSSDKIELIFVYGGGSIPMVKGNVLRKKLSLKLRNFHGGEDIPVIWVPKNYAQVLNELGLDIVLDAIK